MGKWLEYIQFCNSSPPTPLLNGGEGGRRSGGELKKIGLAKALRKNLTPHEQRLWRYLRAKRFNNLKFRRQHPIGPYVADFYCGIMNLMRILMEFLIQSQNYAV